jgi:hypothetical protein
MIVKRTGFNRALIVLAAFTIGVALTLTISVRARAQTAPSTCGDYVCQATENSDLCAVDCQCHDNGVADVGEGCGCKDVVCASLGEGPESACGTPCEETSTCPAGLACFRGTCWDGVICEGSAPDEDAPGSKGCTPGAPSCGACVAGYMLCNDGCGSYYEACSP